MKEASVEFIAKALLCTFTIASSCVIGAARAKAGVWAYETAQRKVTVYRVARYYRDELSRAKK